MSALTTTATNHFELKELSPKHKDVAALMSQGMKRADVAAAVGFTPEYVTMLCRDPQFRSYMQGLAEYHEMRLDLMFEKSVDAISDTLQFGAPEDRLKAARLQLEATKRLGTAGRGNEDLDNAGEKLNRLADRLLALQANARQGSAGQVIDVQPTRE